MPTAPDRAAQKKAELLAFLHEHVFDPILASPAPSDTLKRGESPGDGWASRSVGDSLFLTRNANFELMMWNGCGIVKA